MISNIDFASSELSLSVRLADWINLCQRWSIKVESNWFDAINCWIIRSILTRSPISESRIKLLKFVATISAPSTVSVPSDLKYSSESGWRYSFLKNNEQKEKEIKNNRDYHTPLFLVGDFWIVYS